MTILLVAAVVGLFGIWLLIIHAMPIKMRIMFARKPWLFLLIHIPVMYSLSFVGGEGLIFGIANLIGGIGAQFYLAFWGWRNHGLTFAGRKTPKYHQIHPKKQSIFKRIDNSTKDCLGRAACSATSPSKSVRGHK
jgi:hypothetical protein